MLLTILLSPIAPEVLPVMLFPLPVAEELFPETTLLVPNAAEFNPTTPVFPVPPLTAPLISVSYTHLDVYKRQR